MPNPRLASLRARFSHRLRTVTPWLCHVSEKGCSSCWSDTSPHATCSTCRCLSSRQFASSPGLGFLFLAGSLELWHVLPLPKSCQEEASWSVATFWHICRGCVQSPLYICGTLATTLRLVTCPTTVCVSCFWASARWSNRLVILPKGGVERGPLSGSGL